MWLFDLISDALYNRDLRRSGREKPGEVVYTQGWGKDWKPIDPYSAEQTEATRKALEATKPKLTRAERLRAERAARAGG